MNDSTKAVFLSYASEDAGAASRICQTLREAGIEVWLVALNAHRRGRTFDAAAVPTRSCTIRLDSASYHMDLRLLRKKWRTSAVLVSNSLRAPLKGAPSLARQSGVCHARIVLPPTL